MKKFFPRWMEVLFFSAAVLLFGATVTLADFQEQGGMLVIEAESYHSKSNTGTRDWYIFPRSSSPTPDPDDVHTSGASNSKYVEGLPDTRVTHDDTLTQGVNFFKTGSGAPRMNYKVHISTAGRYYIRARSIWTGTEDNGVHFGYDNNWPTSGSAAQWCGDWNIWTWSGKRRTDAEHCGVYNALYLDLTAGDHTIMVAMREDGFEMDKFILTTASSYFPSGTGPDESSETTGDNNNAPVVNAGSDQTVTINDDFQLSGSATDDGIPDDTLTINWKKVSGPGSVDFSDSSKVNSWVSFSALGSYVLELSAHDGELESTDRIGIQVVEEAVPVDFEMTVLEAEEYDSKVSRNSHSWRSVTKNGADAMKASPDNGTRIASSYVSKSPYMRFAVNLNATGTYYVWLRGYSVSNGNSAHVGLDGKAVSTCENMSVPVKNDWIWSGTAAGGQRAKFSITNAGSHTIEVYMREDGFILDKLLITQESDYTPSGDIGDTEPNPTDSFQQISNNGLVSMQAENRDADVEKNSHSWVSTSQDGVAGMEVVPDSGTRISSSYVSKSPYLQFNVNFIKTGTHYVWVRGHCMGNDNSVHVGLDGHASSTGENLTVPVTKNWVWSGKCGSGQRAKLDVSGTGEHTIEVYMREDGMIVDKVVLTTSSSYTPSGDGPTESDRK